MRLLFVCTGNVCRSPLAERLAALWAESALGADAATVHIRSAGTDALDGQPMNGRAAAALADLGGDPTGFVARTVHPDMVMRADLVLTMTRRQRRLVLSRAPRALRHTFTLPEAADLLRMADLSGVAETRLESRAAELAIRLNAGRAHRRAAEADDVHDPMGQSSGVHQQVAARIVRKLEPLSAALFAEAAVAAPRDLPPHRIPPPPLSDSRRIGQPRAF